MKKTYLLSAVALLSIGLAACSNSKDSSTKSTTTQVGSSANRKLAKDLDKQFNNDGKKIVKTKIETDVISSDVTDKSGKQISHEEIKVLVTDKDTKNEIKKDDDAIRDDTATDDQKMYIANIQEIIEKEAKKLSSNKDVISFGYELDADNTSLVASSMKNRNIITPVEISVQ